MNSVFGNEEAYLAISQYENLEMIQECVNEIDDKLLIKPEIIICGKVFHQRRDVGFFSNESIGYKYSNQLMKSQPLTATLTILLNEIKEMFHADFNGILINRYNDGNDYISPHSDDESALDPNTGVVALSYGGERIFRIRRKKNKEIVHEEITSSGKIIQMAGYFQVLYTHEIPIQKECKDIRYSFTFRKHLK